MLLTLPGIVTLLTLALKNALVPMLVTGNPLVVAGMVTSPPGPEYPVMVTAPLLIVYLSWAWAIGARNSSRPQRQDNVFICQRRPRRAELGLGGFMQWGLALVASACNVHSAAQSWAS